MEKLTRRDFLKVNLGIAAAALLPEFLLAAEEDEAPAGPVIAVARSDPSKNGVSTLLVKAAVDQLGGIEQFISSGDTVCIKPNISFAANRECGATTSPGIAQQVVQLCLDAGAAKVIILDYPLANAKLCVANSGIEAAIVDKKKVSLLMLSQERQFSEIEVPGGQELLSVKVAKAVLQADKLINLPTAKSHSATGVSLGLKNLMGLIWERSSLHSMNLHRAIAELSLVIRPDLTIVDATRALTSGGPGGPGKTVELNTVVAGADVVAVDSYTVGLTPWYNRAYTGKSVKYIAAAAELGLGEIDPEKMTIKEISVE
jgi:uncharacterized protein (DUF362 family)